MFVAVLMVLIIYNIVDVKFENQKKKAAGSVKNV